MAPPVKGRLPKDALGIVAPTFTRFFRPNEFAGLTEGGVWSPRSTSETLSLYWYDPRIDVGSAINFRAHWSTSSSTTSDTATWRVLYDKLTIDTTAIAVATTALSTAIAADNAIGTANVPLRTAAGVLNGGTLTDGQALILALNCNAVSGLTLNDLLASRVSFLGLEVEYVLTNL